MKKAWIKYDCLHDAYVLKLWDEKNSEWRNAKDGVYPFVDGQYIKSSLLIRVIQLVQKGYSVDI
jgi:hypothetical protein